MHCEAFAVLPTSLEQLEPPLLEMTRVTRDMDQALSMRRALVLLRTMSMLPQGVQ
jgi:hypothetical protein